MADDVVRDPPGAIWRTLIERWRAEAARIDGFHATMGTGYHACADELETALRACADDLETAPSPQKGHEDDQASRVGGVPGVGLGDLPREHRNEVVSAPTDNEVVDFLVAYHGYPNRATALRLAAETIFDEAKVIQSWATLRQGAR